MQPVAHHTGDAVDQVVQPHFGQSVGVRAQIQHLAVLEVEGLQRPLVVQGRSAEPLQHPAAVIEAVLLQFLTRVTQHGGKEIGHRHIGGHRKVDGLFGGTYGEAAQARHGAVGQGQGSRSRGLVGCDVDALGDSDADY